MVNKLKKSDVDAEQTVQHDWPKEINLAERLPAGHKRAGHCRYALTCNGAGRMDMVTYRDVPQHLVDAALAAQTETTSDQSVTA